jgi:hypothetical protein
MARSKPVRDITRYKLPKGATPKEYEAAAQEMTPATPMPKPVKKVIPKIKKR